MWRVFVALLVLSLSSSGLDWMSSAPLYSVRPTFKEKFPPTEVKKIISAHLSEFLADKSCVLPLPATVHAPQMKHIGPARCTRGGETQSEMCVFLLVPPRSYNSELTAQWTREIADGIKATIKSQLELPRYKYVVQVVIGEMRGECVRMGCRCLWDADTDNCADESYRNVSVALQPTLTGLPACTQLAAVRMCHAWPVAQLPVPPRLACLQDSLFCVAIVFATYLY